MTKEEAGWYVYGFLAASNPDVSSMKGIDGNSPLEFVPEDGMGVLVSSVPLAEFGEGTFQENLKDLHWLEEKVRLHESIVEAAGPKGTLLPMKFGTIFLDIERVGEILRKNAAPLREAFIRLRDREEWGIKGFSNPVNLRSSLLKTAPRLIELSQKAHLPGHSYLCQKRIEEELSTKTQERLATAARLVADIFREKVEELVEVPSLLTEGEKEETVFLNLACLVKRSNKDALHAEVDRWNTQEAVRIAHGTGGGGAAEEGVRLALSGPWPPYHFVPRLNYDE